MTGKALTRELKSRECCKENDCDLRDIVDPLRPLEVTFVGRSGAGAEKGESAILSIECCRNDGYFVCQN